MVYVPRILKLLHQPHGYVSLPGYKRDSEVHVRTLNSKGGGICVQACLVLRVHIPRLPSTPSAWSPDSQVGLPDEPKTLQQEEASAPHGW